MPVDERPRSKSPVLSRDRDERRRRSRSRERKKVVDGKDRCILSTVYTSPHKIHYNGVIVLFMCWRSTENSYQNMLGQSSTSEMNLVLYLCCIVFMLLPELKVTRELHRCG